MNDGLHTKRVSRRNATHTSLGRGDGRIYGDFTSEPRRGAQVEKLSMGEFSSFRWGRIIAIVVRLVFKSCHAGRVGVEQSASDEKLRVCTLARERLSMMWWMRSERSAYGDRRWAELGVLVSVQAPAFQWYTHPSIHPSMWQSGECQRSLYRNVALRLLQSWLAGRLDSPYVSKIHEWERLSAEDSRSLEAVYQKVSDRTNAHSIWCTGGSVIQSGSVVELWGRMNTLF